MSSSLSPHRRPLLVALLLVLPALAAGAAEVEIGLIAGAQQTGEIGTRGGTLDLAGGPLYGVNFAWRVQADGVVELAWTRQDSEVSGDLRTGPERFDLKIDSVEIGGLWETRPGAMRPFVALSVGATRLSAGEREIGDAWNFSGAIGGGVRWLVGERAIVRLEGRATGIIFSSGGAFACSYPPGGCSVGVSGSWLGAFSARATLSSRF